MAARTWSMPEGTRPWN